jgi:hypothetical protein
MKPLNFLYLILVLLLLSCFGGSNEPLVSVDDISDYDKEVIDRMIKSGNDLVKSNNLTGAISQYTTLINEYPTADSLGYYQKRIDSLDIEVKKQVAFQKEEMKKQMKKYEKNYNSLKRDIDEFKGVTFLKDRNVTSYRNANSVHAYIVENGKSEPYLRMVYQYADDDWLFINGFQLSIDGGIQNMGAFNFERDNDGGSIYEWNDEKVNDGQQLQNLINISESKKTIIRYNGRKYYGERTVSGKQKSSLKNVINAYYYAKWKFNSSFTVEQ